MKPVVGIGNQASLPLVLIRGHSSHLSRHNFRQNSSLKLNTLSHTPMTPGEGQPSQRKSHLITNAGFQIANTALAVQRCPCEDSDGMLATWPELKGLHHLLCAKTNCRRGCLVLYRRTELQRSAALLL